jgi:hypothetical protein
MDLDMTESLAPKSDQLDAVDLLGGPRTFTIEKVTKHNAEQPFNFHLADFPRVWRPGKSMRRVIVAAWGSKAANYVGKRLTLYCDPSVEFGGAAVGGSRISHMSGIDKPLKVPLLIKKGRSAMFTVQPLPDAAPRTEPAANTAPTISDKVRADTAKAIAEGTVPAYLEWLTGQGAPQHITDYVTTTAKEPNA